MSHQRQNKMVNGNTEFGDTTYTKIFVGGLAWETKRDTMKRYFEQFGEILEAVVINDKTNGRSKGYGFVTFRDADSAMRACQNPYPVIDGRKANCNIASLGAQKKNRPASGQHGMQKFGPQGRSTPPSTMYFRQPLPQYAFPQAAYGYPGFPQDMYAVNYYNVYGGQQFASYHTTAPALSSGVYLSYYPLYGQSGPNQQPKMIHHPYLSQQHRPLGAESVSTAATPSLTTNGMYLIKLPMLSFINNCTLQYIIDLCNAVGASAATKTPAAASEKSSSTQLD